MDQQDYEYIAKKCDSILCTCIEYQDAEKNKLDAAEIQEIVEIAIYRQAFIDGFNFYKNLEM